MSSAVFLEFLSCIKQEEKNISLLSNDIQTIKEMEKCYVSSYSIRRTSGGIVDNFKKKTSAFYAQIKEIKQRIENIRKVYSTNGILEQKMNLHVLALYENLKKKTKEFLEAKSSFLNRVTQKQEFLDSFEKKRKDRKETVYDEDSLSADEIADEKIVGDAAIQDILLSIEDIHTTSIELNEIISNSSLEIEGTLSKTFFSKDMSTGMNLQIETAIVRRNRARWFKIGGVLLIVALCMFIAIYFKK